MHLCAIELSVILARCVMLTNMQAYLPSLLPLIRLSGSTWNLVLRSCWHSQNVLEIKKMTEQKKPKRIRQKVIQVVVTEAEKKQIEENAAQGNLSASQYLRDLGLGYQPKSLTDIKTI